MCPKCFVRNLELLIIKNMEKRTKNSRISLNGEHLSRNE